MSAAKAPNSARYCVRDEGGRDFLVTFADLDYEAAFRKHAAWWRSYVRRPGGYRDRAGNHLPTPTGRTQVVVEPYYDTSRRR